MNEKRELDRIKMLADMLESLVEHAKKNQMAADRSVVKVASSADAISSAMREVPKVMVAALDKQLETAAQNAVDRMTAKWQDANKSADQAVQAFCKARERLSMKMAGFIVAITVTVAAITIGSASYVSATFDEVQELKAQRDVLLKNIQALKDAGGDSAIRSCIDAGTNRPCVRVNSYKPEYPGGYRILYGH